MNLVGPDHPALWHPAEPVTDTRPFIRLVEKLEALRVERRAVGIAATQVGASVQMFVTKYDAFRVAFNPRYTPVGDERTSRPEATLSKPGFSTYVARSFRVEAVWWNINGEYCNAPFNDMEARVFCHLTDLLNAKPIFSRPAPRLVVA